jgi:2-iminobutanoate/2-iminopropanoate deaminase
MRPWTTMVCAAGLGALLIGAVPASAQRKVIRPDGAPATRAQSPGVLVGKTLYISAQPGLPGTGATPASMDVQARQAMDGIGKVLHAAGLGYEHLVKCHVYLANMDDYAAMNAAYGSYFKDRVPARTTIQTAGLPGGAGVQIACIGYTDLAGISVVRPPEGSLPAPLGPYSAAVWAGDTLYLSGMGGQDPKTKTVGETVEAQATQTLANITTTLKAAGLELFDVLWAQGYGTRPAEAAALDAAIGRAVQTPRGLVVVPRLPGPIRAEITFVAVRPPATAAYVDATSAPGAGVEAQTRAVLAKLKLALGRAKSDWADVALLSVYLSDLADLPRVDAILAETFPTSPPARVTIQVQPQSTERVRIAMIAAR